MATRVVSRRVLRDQHDGAEADDQDEETDADEESSEAKPKKPRARKNAAKAKALKAPAKPRKKTVKAPSRTVARWAVLDNGMKRVAVFEYTDRAGADVKLAGMGERKGGPFFLQLVKDPYDLPAATEPVVPA